MKPGVLLHKLILLELVLAIMHGTFCFMSFPGYGWYLSSTAALLYCSWFVHNIVAWIKIRPFFLDQRPIFSSHTGKIVSRVYLVTLAMTVPPIILQITCNFLFFNNVEDLYERVRPTEPLFRKALRRRVVGVSASIPLSLADLKPYGPRSVDIIIGSKAKLRHHRYFAPWTLYNTQIDASHQLPRHEPHGEISWQLPFITSDSATSRQQITGHQDDAGLPDDLDLSPPVAFTPPHHDEGPGLEEARHGSRETTVLVDHHDLGAPETRHSMTASSADGPEGHVPIQGFDEQHLGVDVGDNGDSEFQVPSYYADEEILEDPAPLDKQADLIFTTDKLLAQLRSFHGCQSQEHDERHEAHLRGKGNHYGLAEIFPENFPTTLENPRLLPRPYSGQQPIPVPGEWQETFCGCSPARHDGSPKHVCLHKEEVEASEPEEAIDFDSILGFATSLAVSPGGLHYYSAPHFCQNLQNDVHLNMDRIVTDDNDGERLRLMSSKLKDVPHFLFGRFGEANYMTLHIFFPHLECSTEFLHLSTAQFSRWFDQIFYPALEQIYPAHYIQHLPISYRQALASCRAPQVEDRVKETASYRAQMKLSYFLPPESLHQLWSRILELVERPGSRDFRGPQLYFSGKGLKLQFKSLVQCGTMLRTMENFESQLRGVVSFPHISSQRLFLDIAKEVCPLKPSTSGAASTTGLTYLLRRCCLRAYLRWLYDGEVPKTGHQFYHNTMLRDACDMTSLTPARSRLRRGGLLYTQFYSATKEPVDGAKSFPFQNKGLGELALDSKLKEGLQSINGATLRSNGIIRRAYLASKSRCHYSLQDSQTRSFGIREEHLISWPLFCSLLASLRTMNEAMVAARPSRPPEYVWALQTSKYFQFIWHNVNKFAAGFELVRTRTQPGLTTWEQTKIMEMFLRCLKFSLGSHDYSREGALWWSRRDCSFNSTGPVRICYGLGFSQTLEKYGYCWLEPRIDWSRLMFLPDVTDHVLFGASALQKQYIRRGGHVRHFFNITRRIDQGLTWLKQHSGEEFICDRILDWLVHLCLQQFRIDVLSSVRREIIPESQSQILEDKIRFCSTELSLIFFDDMALVSGNRADFKHPHTLANILFSFRDGQQRNHWDDKPYRKHYQRIRAALRPSSGSDEYITIFERRVRRYLFVYHWVLPYPASDSFMQTTKGGKRMWFSVNLRRGACVENSVPNDWYWDRQHWRHGCPPEIPSYLDWSKEEWRAWMNDHRWLSLECPVVELQEDQLLPWEPLTRQNPRRAAIVSKPWIDDSPCTDGEEHTS